MTTVKPAVEKYPISAARASGNWMKSLIATAPMRTVVSSGTAGVDIVLYCGLIVAVGAVNIAQLRTIAGHLKSRRGAAPEAA